MSKQTKVNGIRHGFRSGLEEAVAGQLDDKGVDAGYESARLHYVKPARKAKYTPDFILPNGIVIETKGRFVVEDRQKHLILKEQYPELDIRLVFSNPRSRISKRSKTTYAAWCEKHDFEYAAKWVPSDWLKEPRCPVRVKALQDAVKGTAVEYHFAIKPSKKK